MFWYNCQFAIISISFTILQISILYSNYLVEMDDERESVMMSAEEQKENDLQVGTTLTGDNHTSMLSL